MDHSQEDGPLLILCHFADTRCPRELGGNQSVIAPVKIPSLLHTVLY